MASFSVRNITDTSIDVRVTGISSGDTVRIFIRLYADTSNVKYDVKPVASASYLDMSFQNLEPGTHYAINVKINNDDWLGADDFWTKDEVIRPDNWYWYSTVKQGYPIELSAYEWRAFCNRINEFRTYMGMSEYDFTYVSKGDIITASIVNQARSAIRSISGHGSLPSAARSGNPITASFFIDLQYALNDIS